MSGNQIYFLFCVLFISALMFGGSIPDTFIDRAVRPFSDWFFIHVGEMMSLVYVACVAYIACLHFFTVRVAYDLKSLLACWSFSLAAFSAYGAMRTVPVLARMLEAHGLYYSVCGIENLTYGGEFYMRGTTGSWVSLFIFSKLPELIDTVFIVLRKKPLIFLHWYHHFTVLLYTWHSLAERTSNGLWFAAMNYTVHAFMYAFYGFVALGFRPSWFAKYVTMIQIAQMIVGMAISSYTLASVPECKTSWENGVGSVAMYASYLILFVQFYQETYCGERRQKMD
jgi:elongation of very long chain fatty acids protein 6